MPSATVEQIEADIRHLALADQLRLMEYLAVYIRRHVGGDKPDREAVLKAMAQDPEVQHELRLIDAEFAGTEADGLSGAV